MRAANNIDSMNQHSDIRQFFQAGDFELFCKTIQNIAFNDSELCFDLLWELQRYPVYRHDRHVWDSVAPVRYAGFSKAHFSAYEEKELITMFLARCGEGKDVVDVLRRLFDNHAAEAIQFLLERADEETIARFSSTFLDPMDLAHKATVKIVVRRTKKLLRLTKNSGHYQVFTQKEGEKELPLKFTHQASLVYYLMYLIDRRQKPNPSILPVLKLNGNVETFEKLYHLVYDIKPEDLSKKIQTLLYREDAYGRMRVGRERECVYDIRKCLQKNFAAYKESYFPYAMTATSHLTIDCDKIVFADDAKELLDLTLDGTPYYM